jgi:hypothetical protein
MLELPGQMQVTLVAFYGEKPAELTQLIISLQNMLASALRSAFRPYQLEQVHETPVGLEGHRVDTTIQNLNSGLRVDPSGLLSFVRSDHSIRVRVGGYQHHKEYPFKSRGMHPYVRSFSVQRDIAVAMGWPVDDSGFPNSIDHLRWRFNSQLNVRHKWHKQAGDCDNDFFFVLGRVDRRQIDAFRLQRVVEKARLSLAGLDGVLATIGADTLQFVAYLDPQLPIETSCSFAVNDPALTAERLLVLYPSIASSEKAEEHDEPRKPR